MMSRAVADENFFPFHRKRSSMLIKGFFPAILAASLLAISPAAHAEPASRPSAFRPGVKVEKIYRQQLDDVYFTDWFGQLETPDGSWRDVYFETSDKYVNKGIIRLNCADPEADIDLTLYGVGEYGRTEDRRDVTVPYGDRRPWADGNYQPLFGETPPFEFYTAALERFCK